MNLFKNLFGFAALLFFVVNISQTQAQGPRGGGMMGGGNMDALIEQLDLSSTQVSQLKSLKASLKEDMKAAKNSGDREAMKDLRGAYKAELSTILTPAQMTKMEALKAEHRAERGNGNGRKGKGKGKDMNPEARIDSRIAKMDEQLDLSTAQEGQIKEIMLENVPQMKALRSSGDKDGLKSLRKSQNKAIKSVLTGAQKKKMAALKAERKGK